MMEVEDFIMALPKDEQLLLNRLRSIILDCDPRIQEKLSYSVPYFFHHRRICFLWPSSACSGPKDAKILLGFCYGNLLSNEQRLLAGERRKQVYTARFSSLSEIDERVIREVVLEAVLVDEQFAKAKKTKKY
jgi:hypothetical protein